MINELIKESEIIHKSDPVQFIHSTILDKAFIASYIDNNSNLTVVYFKDNWTRFE